MLSAFYFKPSVPFTESLLLKLEQKTWNLLMTWQLDIWDSDTLFLRLYPARVCGGGIQGENSDQISSRSGSDWVSYLSHCNRRIQVLCQNTHLHICPPPPFFYEQCTATHTFISMWCCVMAGSIAVLFLQDHLASEANALTATTSLGHYHSSLLFLSLILSHSDLFHSFLHSITLFLLETFTCLLWWFLCL